MTQRAGIASCVPAPHLAEEMHDRLCECVQHQHVAKVELKVRYCVLSLAARLRNCLTWPRTSLYTCHVACERGRGHGAYGRSSDGTVGARTQTRDPAVTSVKHSVMNGTGQCGMTSSALAGVARYVS